MKMAIELFDIFAAVVITVCTILLGYVCLYTVLYEKGYLRRD